MDEEVGKVATREGGKEFPKSYSNALSSDCRRKLETILKALITSLEKSEDRIRERS